MAIQLQGNSGTIAEVEAGTRSLRVTTRPIDYGALGSYRFATTIALVVTQAANGTLLSWRWGDATRLSVLFYLAMQALQTAPATATIWPRFQAFVARGFTASDSIGTAVALTGNSMKKRTSMGTTLVTDIRKASVAAGLTVGSRTLDGEAFLEMGTQQTITSANQQVYQKALDLTSSGDMPYVFAQNEGFIIRGPTTVFGAAGTMDLPVEAAWAELTSY
jgi:hypothetical protein